MRTLMGADNALSTVSHVILDEIHERDPFGDLLLLIMRDLLVKYTNLKLILMSASMNVAHFVRFCGGCPVLEVPVKSPKVNCFFLEDVLKSIEYMTPEMQKYIESAESKSSKLQILKQWCIQINSNNFAANSKASKYDDNQDDDTMIALTRNLSVEPVIAERSHLDDSLRIKIDMHLRNAWIEGSDEAFQQLFSLILAEHICVDYQHTDTGVTALIAASCHNRTTIVESLLSYGANAKLCTVNDWDALLWANYFGHKELAQLLTAFHECNQDKYGNLEEYCLVANNTLLTEEEKNILNVYYHSFDGDVDIELICSLIHYIINNSETSENEFKNGSILVFLPGYDDIMKLREKIINDSKRFDANKYVLFTLHSQMQSSDLRRVFRPMGVRKIILSTNFAETSITIDDVMFVIDCGKTKEKSYDSNFGISSVKSSWTSKWNIIQRRSRAAGINCGGICYHLFSKTRFQSMKDKMDPDMIRMPIHDLCLHTKLLAAPKTSIIDFLKKVADPPSLEGIKKSVELLKVRR